MARTATLTMNDKSYSVGLKKLDRKKIYGWSKIDIFDDSNQPCALASIADGQHVLPSGSTTLAGFNAKGEYVSKGSLIGMDDEGKKVEKVPSIFDEPVALTKTDLDEYLSNIKSSEDIKENRVEVEMLQNALDLTDKKLRECMIPRTEIVAIDVNSPIHQLKAFSINLITDLHCNL